LKAGPDGTNAAAPGTNAGANRREMLRQAMLAAEAAKTNAATRQVPPQTAGNAAASPAGTPAAAATGTPAAGNPAAAAGTAGEQLTVAATPSSGSTNAAEPIIAAGEINFPGTDLKQVLQIYADLVGRTILQPATLPAPTIILKTQTPLTRTELIQAFDAVLGMNGIGMINVGDKFVKAVPLAGVNAEGGARSTKTPDQMPDFGQYVTHIVQLKYTKPTEMAPALQPFAKIPNAILPFDGSGILVLRDFTENVKRMLEMIKDIDVVVPSEIVSEVIPIKYALASEIATALNSLGTGGGGGSMGGSATGSRPGGATGGTSRGTGFNRTGAGVGTGMGGAYPGQTGFGAGVQGTVSPGATGAGGGSFTDRLQAIIKRVGTSGDIQVLGQTKIISDERTNSLLIFATKEDMKMIKDIISKLDVVLAQVLIEAVIIEVTLTDSKDVGFSYLQHPQNIGSWTGVGAGGGGRNFFVPGNFIASGGTNAAGNASGLTSGFNYLMSWNQDLDVTMNFVANDSNAKVLQRPRIQTSHAVPASLFVGESRPYPTGSYYGGGSYGSYSSIQQLQIGVSLDVTPLINPDGLVVMDIHQKIDSFTGNVTIQGVGDVPVTSSKDATAKVAVRDHDTIILGGLIETDKSTSKSGIPYLMDIPLLGYLFRATHGDGTRKEMIVLIRPTVLPTPELAALAATAEKSKMPGVKRAEVELRADEAKRLRAADAEERKERENAELKH
jgi:general secretion pathway protein D